MDTDTASMAPPSEAPVPFLRRRGQRILPQAWDEQRLRLQKLYVDLDMTLPETMRAMENDYNFYASEKQYKTKIKHWKMTKNANEDKMKNMLRKAKRRRTEEGKNTMFTLNGREVGHERLDRFQKRRKLQDNDIGSSTVSTASRVQYTTPAGQTPYATPARNSPERTGSETGSSLAPSTISPGSRSTSRSGSVLLRLSWNGLDMRALRDMCRRATILCKDKNPTEALEIYRQVLAGYEYLLGPNQDDVVEVIGLMADACLELANNNEAEALYIRAVSGYESLHGPDYKRSLFAVARLAFFYKTQGRFEDSEVLYLRAINGLDTTLPLSDVTLRIHEDLAKVYYHQGFNEKASIWHKRIIADYLRLGAGHEDALLNAEIRLSQSSLYDRDPATESLLTDVLAKCEVRYGENHENVFTMMVMMCSRYRGFQDSEKFETYYQRLCHFKSRFFAKDETIGNDLLSIWTQLAHGCSIMGRYEEAESLFTRLKAEIDEATSVQYTGPDDLFRVSIIFELVILHADHHMRQSKWEDAEPLLLKSKSLEGPFCRSYYSRALVKAFKDFRIRSGREAGGVLPLAQRTSDTETQGALGIPGQTVEDANTVLSVGSADFLQSLRDIELSDFPMRSLPWSPIQPPAPPGVNRPGFLIDPENDDMIGMHDVVDWESSDVMGMQDVVYWENSDAMGTHDVV